MPKHKKTGFGKQKKRKPIHRQGQVRFVSPALIWGNRHPGERQGVCYRTLCRQLFWDLDQPSIRGPRAHALRSFGAVTFLIEDSQPIIDSRAGAGRSTPAVVKRNRSVCT
jgi:hypothetical protein